MRGFGQFGERTSAELRKLAAVLSRITPTLFLLGLAATARAEVVVNELMYHPYQPYPVITNLAEYVEVYNAGASTVVLGEYRFDNGIDFNFTTNDVLAPGAYLVVYRDAAAFTAAYPTVTNKVGPYGGALDNASERVTLSKRVAEEWVEVHSIRYVDVGASDGDGPSLELVHPGFARVRDHFPGAWAVSTSTNGTPGRVNGTYNATPAPVVGDYRHTPALPPAGTAVQFSAGVWTYDGSKPKQVTLLYRVDQYPQGVWIEVEMGDSGIDGDEILGDGIYGVRLPLFNEPGFASGQMLEFQFRATDVHDRSATAPFQSWGGVLNGPYSCLMKFGEDPGYTGEYTTYHILLTELNRIGPAGLEVRGIQSDVLLDSTIITADGEVFYNCGLRIRGGSSRNATYGGYRIELPKGRSYQTYSEINLNHQNALSQYMGLALADRLGYDCVGQEVALSRVWVNTANKIPTSQGIYVRIEGYDDHIIARGFSNTDGNRYKTDGDGVYDGDLRYTSNLSEYEQNSTGDSYYNYMCATNNPYTVWTEMQALCQAANDPVGTIETTFPARANARQWARLYALQVCLANDESGWLSPYGTRGDETRLYADPTSQRFHVFPWDMDAMLERTDSGLWLWDHTVARNFLFRQPMVGYYVGDVLDIFSNLMSPATINAFWDEMGSALPQATRTTWQNNLNTLASTVRAQIKTNLVVTIGGTVASGSLATIVNASPAAFSGEAPMNYTASLKVNGTPATWTAWDVANMASSNYGKWSLAPLALSPGANTVLVKTFDFAGNSLLSRELTVVNRATSTTRSGTVSGNTTWNSASGVIVVVGNVTVTSGARLTIAAGTTVLVNSGLGITVNNGTIDVQGTAAAPVWFVPSDGASTWTMTASGASAALVVSNAVTVGGAVVVASGAQAALTDSTLRNSSNAGGILQSSGGASVTLVRCIVSNFVKTAFAASTVSVSDSLLRWMTAAGIEVNGGTATIQRTTVRASSAAASVDGIRALGGAAVTADRCLMLDTRGSGLTASGTSTQAGLLRSAVAGAGTGVKRASPATVRNVNNTIVAGTLGFEGAQSVTNAIVWANTSSVASGPATVAYSLVQQAGTNAYAGVGNLNRNPWFVDLSARDIRLLSISPCEDAGSDGLDMGAAFPVGSNPADPTGLAASSGLNGGTNRITLSWQDQSADETGFEVWRREAGGAWGLLATTAPNVLTYFDLAIVENAIYEYRVRAVHARGESFFTDTETIVASFSAYTQKLIDNLRITEIMYNPASTNDLDEFIEIKNISQTLTLDLSGAYLDNSRHVFPAGFTLGPRQFFVLARNAAAFQAVHGFAPDAQYAVDDPLSNGGENLFIRTAQSNRVFYCEYKDGLNWPTAADGEGYSLVPVNPNSPPEPVSDPFSSSYWRASANPGGSPDEDDPEPPYGTIVINEVLAHTDPPQEDAIELYNAGTNAVDIAGWFLADRADFPRSYAIPGPSLILQPGGYRVFYEGNSFNADTNSPDAFTLSSLGETVYLSSGNGTNLTSYRTGVSFGATFNGVSIGRYVRSDGKVEYTAMSQRTFGSDNATTPETFRTGTGLTNAYPRISPVVINEVMYAPSTSGSYEFLELYNRSGAPVPLYDPLYPTNTWQIRNAISYAFPTGIVMAAGERIIVTHVDPALFRAEFGITNQALRVFGPFDGRLANEGESVELFAPDGITEGVFPYVLADKVNYESMAPWPAAAAGQGASLERIDPAAYGNDPANWRAGTLGGTPGEANNTAGLPSVGFPALATVAWESYGTVSIPVVVEPVATAGTVTVQYAVTGGTAARGPDYTLADGSLLFWPYDATNHIVITLAADGVALEPDETVVITLTSVSPNARLGGIAQHTLTIVDTDTGVVAAPSILPVSTNFYVSVEVTMTTTTSQASIWYTLDGSEPVVSNTPSPGAFSPSPAAVPYSGLAVHLTDGTRVKAAAVTGAYSVSPVTSRLFLEQTPENQYPPGTIVRRIAQSSDDAQENANFSGGMVLNKTNIILNYDSAYFRTGLRFTSIDIPQGALVTEASIQFRSVAAGSGTPVTDTIYAQAVDNATTFLSIAKDIRNRARTTASVPWLIAEWTGPNLAGPAQRTPDLSALVQEVVNRPGWNSGNAIVFIFVPPSFTSLPIVRPAYAYDGNPDYAAYLLLRFTAPPVTDADGDSMPDDWEEFYFGSTNALHGGTFDDYDEDGFVNLSEYIAGTDPTDEFSFLAVLNTSLTAGPAAEIAWLSVTGRTYSVYRALNLAQPFGAPLTSGVPANPSGTNTFADTQNTNTPVFYRIGVAFPDAP